MEIEDETFWLFSVKVQAINAYVFFYFEVHFPERDVVFEFEIGMEFFGFENKKVLQKINCNCKEGNRADDIVDDERQAVGYKLRACDCISKFIFQSMRLSRSFLPPFALMQKVEPKDQGHLM